MQAVVAFLISIFTAIFPSTPSVTTPSLPLKNVNPNPIAEAVKSQDFKIMSYNLKISGDGLRAVEKRLTLIVDTINAHTPDSFGVQEADKRWVESLAAELELAGVCQETKGKAVYWVISTSGATSATAKSTWPSMVVVNTIMLSPCTKRGWGSI